jgi:hypothetical protein
MAEVMTWEQLFTRYPDEWAVIIEPECGEGRAFVSGLVLLHTPDRAAAMELTLRIREQHPQVICLSTTLKYLPTMQVIRDPDHPALKGGANGEKRWQRS